LIDPKTNEEIGDSTEVSQAGEAEARRAEAEARARAEAETRVRELEEEVRRLRGRKTR
jgi:uncharacterized protein YceH (UPF0502 family)